MADADMREDSRVCKRCDTTPITGYKFCSDCDPWRPKGFKRGRKPANLLGRRIGRLVCVEATGEKSRGSYLWLVNCDCGTKGKKVSASYLTKGAVRSCGCLRSELSSARMANGRAAAIQPKKMGKPCIVCGEQFSGTAKAKYCGNSCRWAAGQQQKPKVHVPCEACGSPFNKWHPNNRFCSFTCRKRVEHAERNAMRRMAERKNKVDPLQVFMRDGWRCRMCGCHTPQRERGKYTPNSPELDHIVPLSRGGEHSYRNTQLLCRSCNQIKSNKIIGQLRLFG